MNLSCLSFTCQWKVQASGRLLSLSFFILFIKHSFHIMFRFWIWREMRTFRQLLLYLTLTWTFLSQQLRVSLNFTFRVQTSQSRSRHWFVSFCELIKLAFQMVLKSSVKICCETLSKIWKHDLTFTDRNSPLYLPSSQTMVHRPLCPWFALFEIHFF